MDIFKKELGFNQKNEKRLREKLFAIAFYKMQVDYFNDI